MGEDAVEVVQCPFCAEDIRAAAVKCKHCGSMLDGSVADLATSAQTFQCLVCQRAFPIELERCPGCRAVRGHASVMADGTSGPDPVRSEGAPAAATAVDVSVSMILWIGVVLVAGAVAYALSSAALLVGGVTVVILLGGLMIFEF